MRMMAGHLPVDWNLSQLSALASSQNAQIMHGEGLAQS